MVKKTTGLSGPVRYHLRITLNPAHARAQEKALFAIIRRAKIDGVIFIPPSSEENSPGLGTPAECEESVAALKPVFSRLRRAGVIPSVNIWWTLGFKNYPSEIRSQRSRYPGFRWAVSLNGRVSEAIACPLDKAWLAEAARVYRSFAALKPEVMWMDDDLGSVLRADMKSPCFCDACLDEMGKRTGCRRTREDLFKAVLADPPNPVREAWLDFQNEYITGIMRTLSGAVHAVSPETHMGLMHGGPSHFSATGRRWKEVAAALGTPVPFFRPPAGSYVEGIAQDLAFNFAETRIAQSIYPGSASVAPEIENTPFSRFYKSARFTRAQMLLCQLAGMREITLSLHPYPGGRFELGREHKFDEMLAENKPLLQAVADLNIRPEQMRGVGLSFHEEIGRFARDLSSAGHTNALNRVRKWDAILPMMGMATSYNPGAAVRILSCEEPACMTPEELKQAFSGGVLLDARAAETLIKLGKGEWAGIRTRLENGHGSMEIITDRKFGREGEVLSLRKETFPWQFDWRPGAREISRLKGFTGQFTGHGVVLFENNLGGRVAVYPFDPMESAVAQGMLSPSFINWTRQAQLKAVLEWLGKRPLPLFIPDAPNAYPFLAVQEGRLVVAAANLSTDPVATLKFILCVPGRRVRKVLSLDGKGRWRKIRAKISESRQSAAVDTGTGLDNLETGVFILEE